MEQRLLRRAQSIARFRFSRMYRAPFLVLLAAQRIEKYRMIPTIPMVHLHLGGREMEAPVRTSELPARFSLLAKSDVRLASRVKSRSGQSNFRAIGLKCEPRNRAVNFVSSSATAGSAAGFIPPIVDFSPAIHRACSRRQSRRGPEITNFST